MDADLLGERRRERKQREERGREEGERGEGESGKRREGKEREGTEREGTERREEGERGRRGRGGAGRGQPEERVVSAQIRWGLALVWGWHKRATICRGRVIMRQSSPRCRWLLRLWRAPHRQPAGTRFASTGL